MNNAAAAVEIKIVVTRGQYLMTIIADGQLYASAYQKDAWAYAAALDNFGAQHRERIRERVPVIRIEAEAGVAMPRL